MPLRDIFAVKQIGTATVWGWGGVRCAVFGFRFAVWDPS